MKRALSLILLCFVSSVQAEEQTRTYFIMNLEKGGSNQKFEEMFSQCGGVAVEKIIIQVTHRD